MGDPLTIEVRHEQDYVIVTAAGAHAWRRVLDPEPTPEPQERDIAVPQDS